MVVEWFAVLAMDDPWLPALQRTLARETVIDAMTLTPMGGTLWTDALTNVQGVVAHDHATIPIRVRGALECESWFDDGCLSATRRVTRLAA